MKHEARWPELQARPNLDSLPAVAGTSQIKGWRSIKLPLILQAIITINETNFYNCRFHHKRYPRFFVHPSLPRSNPSPFPHIQARHVCRASASLALGQGQSCSLRPERATISVLCSPWFRKLIERWGWITPKPAQPVPIKPVHQRHCKNTRNGAWGQETEVLCYVFST